MLRIKKPKLTIILFTRLNIFSIIELQEPLFKWIKEEKYYFLSNELFVLRFKNNLISLNNG